MVVFSQDILPHILHQAASLPLARVDISITHNHHLSTPVLQLEPEVWLTGLVGLAGEVVRMGVRDLFTKWVEGMTGCYWVGRGAVWGEGTQLEGVKNITCQEGE